jgi:CO dehydrogenase/acetyl-CoA synthase gamma subunit (corrinoid Fe-S protein)
MFYRNNLTGTALIKRIEEPSALRCREHLPEVVCKIGENIFLDYVVITPKNVSPENFKAIEALLEPVTEAAKVALCTFNEYRRAVRIRVDADAPKTYIKSLEVFKQGTQKTEPQKVRYSRSTYEA